MGNLIPKRLLTLWKSYLKLQIFFKFSLLINSTYWKRMLKSLPLIVKNVKKSPLVIFAHFRDFIVKINCKTCCSSYFDVFLLTWAPPRISLARETYYQELYSYQNFNRNASHFPRFYASFYVFLLLMSGILI